MHFPALVCFFTFFTQAQAVCDIGQDLGIFLCSDNYVQAIGLQLKLAFSHHFYSSMQLSESFCEKNPIICPNATSDLYDCIDGAVQQDCIETLLVGLAVFLFAFFTQIRASCDIGQVDTIALCYDVYMQAFGLPSLLGEVFM
ncbi:unnamed protein product, partial [Mesorhabditis belari]|uniref:Uncharacterized protein n=1 Tax=Mesorhabditis belari TaxID=2138241 RepID=A0AAF3ETL2_9BILA